MQIKLSLRSALAGCCAIAIVILVTVGLFEIPTKSSRHEELLSLTEVRAALAGAPEPLAALHAQAGDLIAGDAGAVRTRIAALQGEPVVVNKWASWCVPCRAEFGVFQRVSVHLGRSVAFLGIDSGDPNRDAAMAMLRSRPVGYPNYFDPTGQVGTELTLSSFMPVTAFFDRRGHRMVIQGPFTSVASLERAIRLYALPQ